MMPRDQGPTYYRDRICTQFQLAGQANDPRAFKAHIELIALYLALCQDSPKVNSRLCCFAPLCAIGHGLPGQGSTSVTFPMPDALGEA
ncbi:MAG: hypothetical protein ACTHOJ_01000 [Sphingomonas oligoaromativorans]